MSATIIPNVLTMKTVVAEKKAMKTRQPGKLLKQLTGYIVHSCVKPNPPPQDKGKSTENTRTPRPFQSGAGTQTELRRASEKHNQSITIYRGRTKRSIHYWCRLLLVAYSQMKGHDFAPSSGNMVGTLLQGRFLSGKR